RPAGARSPLYHARLLLSRSRRTARRDSGAIGAARGIAGGSACLCVIAGFGTMLLLPSHLQPPMRRLGGALLIACGLVLLALLVRSATANNQHVAQSFY